MFFCFALFAHVGKQSLMLPCALRKSCYWSSVGRYLVLPGDTLFAACSKPAGETLHTDVGNVLT